ncbi:MAG: hypothetical protein ACRC28_09880 [Clostridium sp.]|uniref:hypothetical protein n=1 Tax=Clostridium sp. TaxID=1506 RepID=UPI003F31616B
MNYKKENYLWFFIDWVIYIFVILFFIQMYVNQMEISNGGIFQIASEIFKTNNLLIILLLLGIFAKGIYFIINKILLKLLKVEIESLKLSFTITSSIVITLLIVSILLDFNLIQGRVIFNILVSLLSPIIMITGLKEEFKNNNKLYLYLICLMSCICIIFFIL